MDDRGENIVNLAREMLQQRPAMNTPLHHYSLKTIAMAAMISAAGAGAVGILANEHSRPLNRYERVELIALIHYAAKQRGDSMTIIESDLFHQFGIQSFDDLTKGQMNEARHYLQKQIR